MLARALFSSLAIAFAALLLSAPARAQAGPSPTGLEVIHPPPIARVFADLSYERTASAGVCPDEPTFRFLMSTRMGVDSFQPNPRGERVGRVRVGVSRTSGSFVASYTWVNKEGATKTARYELKGASKYDCTYLLEEIAARLAEHFTLIEVSLGRKATRARPSMCPAAQPCQPIESPYSVWPREPSLDPESSERSKLPDRWPLAARLGLSVWPELIVSGKGALGITAELGVRYRFFSVGAELHGDPPLAPQVIPTVGQLNIARLSGALLLCVHFGWFEGCGVGDFGRLFFTGDTQKIGFPTSTFYGAAGVRAGLEFPVAPPWFFLRVALDLRVPVIQTSFVLKETTLLQIAGFAVGAGLGFVVELR